MTQHRFSPLAILALSTLFTLGLTGCQTTSSAKTANAGAATPVAAAASHPAAVEPQRRELAYGLYELAYSPKTHALYAASALLFKGSKGGIVYTLDPVTLATTNETHTDLKNFGLASDPDGSTIYITNSLDGGISALDAQTGEIKGRLLFGDRGPEGKPLGAREIIYQDGLLYVGAVGNPAVIWVVDAQTLKLKTTIKDAGKWVTGLLFSPSTQRLYAANGGGEVLVINPKTHKIQARWKPDDGQKYLLLNLAEDPATHRLFVTDNSAAKTTLVFDDRTGNVIKRLPVGDSLGIKFNPVRNEIYITQRESGKLLILDGTSYAVKKTYALPPKPNSLLVAPDGQTLYVTVKEGLNKDRSAKGPDSVVRIKLN